MSILVDFIYCVQRHFQQNFSYIMATSFSGGKSRSTRREPPTVTMGKQLINFITCGYMSILVFSSCCYNLVYPSWCMSVNIFFNLYIKLKPLISSLLWSLDHENISFRSEVIHIKLLKNTCPGFTCRGFRPSHMIRSIRLCWLTAYCN